MFSGLTNPTYYTSQALTWNLHYYGIDSSKFSSDAGLAATFKPTTYSYDTSGNAFVATMEAYSYPFMGAQFHPEISSASSLADYATFMGYLSS